MRRLPGIALCLVGLVGIALGIALMIWNNAETWLWPTMIGGTFALLGLAVAAIGWFLLRLR